MIDLKTEAIAVREAQRLRIPIIGLVDTNCDPDGIDYVIPGNDDAIRSCAAITRAIGDVVAQGHGVFRAEEEAARLERERQEAEERARREAEEQARREAEERAAAEAAAARGRGAGAAGRRGGCRSRGAARPPSLPQAGPAAPRRPTPLKLLRPAVERPASTDASAAPAAEARRQRRRPEPLSSRLPEAPAAAEEPAARGARRHRGAAATRPPGARASRRRGGLEPAGRGGRRATEAETPRRRPRQPRDRCEETA